MDPISALGLAAAVVQFASLSAKIIKVLITAGSSASELTSGVADLDHFYSALRAQSQRLSTAHHDANHFIGRETLEPHRAFSRAPQWDDQFLESAFGETTKAIAFPTLLESYQNLKGLLAGCSAECSKIMDIVARVKSHQKSGWSWAKIRETIRLVLKKGEIEKIEEQVSKYNAAVLTELCNISAIYHNIHHDNLANFRRESRRLGLELSSRLESIESMLQKLIDVTRGSGDDMALGTQHLADLEQTMARVSLSEKEIGNHLRVLRTLTFETRTVRHDAIPLAHKRTFQWVFRKHSSNIPSPDQANDINADSVGLLEWLARGEGTFWVSGKPGSGKSTFMKFLADQPTTKKALAEWAHPLPVFVGSHYFWISGTMMQKSQEGLLRSLLFDMFSRCPDLIRASCPARWEAKEDSPWTVTEMRSIIEALSTQSLIPSKFCFFIDGLDEFDGEHLEFCESLLSMASSPNIKLCVSSRPWNVFEQALGQDRGRKIYIHELTKHDVFEYARDRLQQHPRWNQVESQMGAANALIKGISEKAQGVFLWVFLVTKLLREGLTNYDTFKELQERLDSFPSDLEPFFMQIVKSVPEFYRERMAETLKIALADPEPLDALIYSYHDGEDVIHHSITDSQRIECVARRLNGRCRGLLEINFMGQIGFLHRTVVDFLRTREMATFLDQNTGPDFSPNLAVLRHYGTLIWRSQFSDREDFSNAVGRALRYARRAEFEKVVPKELDSAVDRLEDRASSKYILGTSSDSGHLMDTAGFRKAVIELPLTGYLMRKFAQNPGYLAHFRNPGALALLRDAFPSSKGWTPDLPQLVAQLLKNANPPNQAIAGTGHTIWSSFLAELMPVTQQLDLISRVSGGVRFLSALQLGLFPLFLHHGANPNVSLHGLGQIGRRYAHTTYPLDRLLAVAHEITPDPATEQGYVEAILALIMNGATISRLEGEPLKQTAPYWAMDSNCWRYSQTHEHPCETFFNGVQMSLATDHSRKSFFQNVMRSVLPLVRKAEWPLYKYEVTLKTLELIGPLTSANDSNMVGGDSNQSTLHYYHEIRRMDTVPSLNGVPMKRGLEGLDDFEMLGNSKKLRKEYGAESP